MCTRDTSIFAEDTSNNSSKRRWNVLINRAWFRSTLTHQLLEQSVQMENKHLQIPVLIQRWKINIAAYTNQRRGNSFRNGRAFPGRPRACLPRERERKIFTPGRARRAYVRGAKTSCWRGNQRAILTTPLHAAFRVWIQRVRSHESR